MGSGFEERDIERELRLALGTVPKDLDDILFADITKKKNIPEVDVPLDKLSEPWCSWPENTPEVRHALTPTHKAYNVFFSFLVARMLWCQFMVCDQAFSFDSRRTVYLLYLYMDQHVPWIIASEIHRYTAPNGPRDLYALTEETQNICLLRFRSLCPLHVEVVHEAGLPQYLLGPRTVLMAIKGNAKTEIEQILITAFPRRCFSKEKEDRALKLLEGGDARMKDLFLCSVLGNYREADFRQPLGQRVCILQASHNILVKRAKAWEPCLSLAVREYVATYQLSLGQHVPVTANKRFEFQRFWHNVLRVNNSACRKTISTYDLKSEGSVGGDRGCSMRANIDVWIRHASHNTPVPKRNEPGHEQILRQLKRSFSTDVFSGAFPTCLKDFWKKGAISSESFEALEPLLHYEARPSRDTVSKVIKNVKEDERESVMEAAVHARGFYHAKNTLIFVPLPHAFYRKHKHMVQRFCPNCFALDFPIPRIYPKGSKFVWRYASPGYEKVCPLCTKSGTVTSEVNLKGMMVIYKNKRAIMCTSCNGMTRLEDGTFHCGHDMFQCIECVKKKRLLRVVE